MVVAPVDSPIIRSREVQDMLDQYEDKCAAQVYKEILEKALQDNKPYHIVSHRYDDFDH